MGFRFRRSLKIAPGVRLNLSKSGPSVSVGPRGAKITVGPKGTRTTVGLPGTGLSYTAHTPRRKADGATPSAGNPLLGIVVVVVLILLASAVLAAPARAHGGGLDANGCHTDRKTGEYHCHRPPRASSALIPLERQLIGYQLPFSA